LSVCHLSTVVRRSKQYLGHFAQATGRNPFRVFRGIDQKTANRRQLARSGKEKPAKAGSSVRCTREAAQRGRGISMSLRAPPSITDVGSSAQFW
jgi:hypothetical protein